MGFDQYHEPAAELSAETRTFARMIASLTEEAEAIGWYEQRMALEPDAQAKAIMANAQGEEFKHFGMDLEFLLRRTPKWRIALQTILFTDGDIVESGEKADEGRREPLMLIAGQGAATCVRQLAAPLPASAVAGDVEENDEHRVYGQEHSSAGPGCAAGPEHESG